MNDEKVETISKAIVRIVQQNDEALEYHRLSQERDARDERMVVAWEAIAKALSRIAHVKEQDR